MSLSKKLSIARIKSNSLSIFIPILITMTVLLFGESLYGLIKDDNYVITHLIMMFFIVTVSASIALQAWIIFPHTLSNHRLYLGALFFTITIIEICHAITYEGMPFFFIESSAYQSTWFYMINRLILPVALLGIVLSKEKSVSSHARWVAYGAALAYSFVWIILLYAPVNLLPDLVIEGIGPTNLKNNLQYIALSIQVVVVFYVLFKYKASKFYYAMILLASLYFIFSDILYTSYISVYGIENFLGHIFQVIGSYYLLRALYRTSVEEPFQIQKSAVRKMEYIAYHDELTGLPNRGYFIGRLKEKIHDHPNKKLSVLLLDIEGFKNINEALGHSFGDKLLTVLTKQLRQSLPKNALLARLNGDEFTLLLSPIENEQEVYDICHLIQSSLEESIQVQNLKLKVSMNIGIAIFPEHGKDEEELLKNANIAMFKAKDSIDRIQTYDSAMSKELFNQLILESALHQALNNNEFYLVYQPQVNMETMDVFALEALIRWKHPTLGIISPGEFIPIIEKNGLILPIGEWVLRSACRQLREWHIQGFSNLRISVNLSSRQLYQDNFVSKVEEILNENELLPSHLAIEITESMAMVDIRHSLEILQGLKKLGVHIAIDDFGTGYSSLNYLNRLPFDQLKIDQSFVRDILIDGNGNKSIVSMICSMARHLKIDVIAEGVEELEQVELLKERGCSKFQGYLFSKPIESEHFAKEYHGLQNEIMEIHSLKFM